MPCAVSAATRASRAEEGDRKEARSPEEEVNYPHFPPACVGGTCEIPRKPRCLPTVSTEELADCSLASASLLFLGGGFLVEGVMAGTWVELPVTHGPGM